jgi:PIN domain nuclease of toxin-antitoxin system
MRVLLDTHVFLWWVEGDRPLPTRAKKIIADQENECLFSLASVWELAIKSNLGKLRLAIPVQRYVVEHVSNNTFALLDIRIGHMGLIETLPRHHGDPFDRLLIAQAIAEDLPVISADPIFRKYGVKRIWS